MTNAVATILTPVPDFPREFLLAARGGEHTLGLAPVEIGVPARGIHVGRAAAWSEDLTCARRLSSSVEPEQILAEVRA